MKKICKLLFATAASTLLLAGTVSAQDVLTTLEGLRVEGSIIKEDDEEIHISTEYGDLRFMKMNLKTIERSGAASGGGNMGNAGGFGGDPFALDGGGPPNTGSGGNAGGFGNADDSGNPFNTNSGGGFGGNTGFGAAPSGPRGFGGFGIPMSEIDTSTAAPANTGFGNAGFGADTGGSGNDGGGLFGGPATGSGGSGFDSGAESNPFSFDNEAELAPGNTGGAFTPPANNDPFGMGTSDSSNSGGPAFGGENPFGFDGAGSSNSREVAAAAPMTGDRETATDAGSGGLPTFGGQRAEKPTVESGYDAVVYGMNDTLPIQVLRVSSQQWSTAAQDTQLAAGSEVKTNESKSARMLLRGKEDELRLPQKSHIEVATLSDDSEEVVINLKSGSVWVDVAPRSKPDAFQIRTPELTAGVRGTNFRVDRSSGSSRVSVFEGTVHVTANRTGTFVTLNANEAAVVNLHGQILDLIAIPKSEQEIYDGWQDWAFSAGYGSGTVAASFSPVASLSQRIASDNAQWEASMQEYMQNVAEMRYQDKLEEYADAFMRYSSDTGYIPESDEGWSLLKFDDGRPGWNGPYVEGSVPPLDPWKRPLVYLRVVSPTGRVFGRVYSVWQDGHDQGGVNSSVDKVALIRYYDLDRFANDPEVNPPN